DQDAAKTLPGLSQALLREAALVAASRQELDRVQAQTATSPEQTMRLIAGITGASAGGPAAESLIAAIGQTQPGASTSANDNPIVSLREGLDQLREEVAQLRKENTAGHAATAGKAGAIVRKLDDVTAASGGDAISVAGVAA